MPDVLHFYMDDSGTRYPDRKRGTRAAHGYDWFALGGILIDQVDEVHARELHAAFCRDWKITAPLHSVEIRNRNENFLWLEKLDESERKRFYEDLYQLMKESRAVALACVIDRTGYNHRYAEKHQNERWLLCKTAFGVAVERAAKHARFQGFKLRVMPERCNKREDSLVKGYYADLKANGMPFSTSNSSQYDPLSAQQFSETLYEFKVKNKTSPMAQFADLFLWPICMGGYHASNWPYQRLMQDGLLIEAHLPKVEWPTRGTKYSCFENIVKRP